MTKWVKLPIRSGCLDLSKTPDATVPCIRSTYCQFQAENTDLPDLYTQQHRHHTIKISNRHENVAYDWFKLNTKRFVVFEHRIQDRTHINKWSSKQSTATAIPLSSHTHTLCSSMYVPFLKWFIWQCCSLRMWYSNIHKWTKVWILRQSQCQILRHLQTLNGILRRALYQISPKWTINVESTDINWFMP